MAAPSNDGEVDQPADNSGDRRRRLRDRTESSRLADGKRLTRSLATAYREMWARYCNGEHEQKGSMESGEEHDVGHV